MIKTVRDVDLKGKRVIMRVDFNVPMKDGKIQDDTRIIAALPTINYILEQKVRSLVLISHLGDPEKDALKARQKAEKEGKTFDLEQYLNGKHRLMPISVHLSEKLGKKVVFLPSCIGQKNAIDALPEGSVILLENSRFHAEETAKDISKQESFAKELAQYGEVFVNDAFGTAHRAHASTTTVSGFCQHRVGGFLMEKEVENLEPMLHNPPKPFMAIIGGAKVSSKIEVLKNLLKNASTLLIGGGMAYTFLKAQNRFVGASLVEEDFLDTASELMQEAEKAGVKIILPIDHIAATAFLPDAEPIPVGDANLPDNLIGLDIGPKTINLYQDVLAKAQSILWNGPVGVFEFEAFSRGTQAVAFFVADATARGAMTVVGGGDSVAAVNKFGLTQKMTHVSTGGGASLEYLEGKTLPGIACLETK